MLTLFPRFRPNPPVDPPPAPPGEAEMPAGLAIEETPVEHPLESGDLPAIAVEISLCDSPSPASLEASPRTAVVAEDAAPIDAHAAEEAAAPVPALATGNLFDDLEVLHEAAVFVPEEPEAAPPGDSAPARIEYADEQVVADCPGDADPATAEASAALETDAAVEEDPPLIMGETATAASVGEVETDSPKAVGQPALAEAVAVPARKATGEKRGFFVLARVPEPEVMEESGDVEAYASAAAQSHLDAIDDTFVARAQLLLRGKERGRVLDIGTGPGQIVLKLGYRLTRWKFVGVDRSPAMVEKARGALATAAELAGRVEFLVADGNCLDFPDASFDMVVSNSVLHHLEEPQRMLAEMARLVKPGGALLLRDLRRPSRLGFGLHARRHGKHYKGEMRRLYLASLCSAYTEEELQKMVAASPLRGVTLFLHGKTHIGIERAISAPR